jgi:pimeloyl-ACP methyl ester carboxylesterase
LATFVLVHGGWQGAWSYKTVCKLLRAKGHEVHAVTLTGLGERSHLSHVPINLETHIEDVVNLIVWEDLAEVYLVGHSYGGMVITGVADRISERIAGLVYLDALVPKDGDTLFSLRPNYREAFLARAAAAEGRFIDPPPASDFDAKEQHWALIDSKTTRHPLGCFTQALALSGRYLKVKSRTFIYAEGNIFDGVYDEYRDAANCEVVAVQDSGHSIMIDQPEEVAKILNRVSG